MEYSAYFLTLIDKECDYMKKVWIVVLVIAIIALLNGIAYLVEGIDSRGISGVNYGRVIFPLLIGVGAVYALMKGRK